ncbi:MAG: hypothetical protein KKD48_01965 [Nanoarchaeota archaeon]|nr:hypothetical protein [Nanoarchaeota archaeon]
MRLICIHGTIKNRANNIIKYGLIPKYAKGWSVNTSPKSMSYFAPIYDIKYSKLYYSDYKRAILASHAIDYKTKTLLLFCLNDNDIKNIYPDEDYIIPLFEKYFNVYKRALKELRINALWWYFNKYYNIKPSDSKLYRDYLIKKETDNVSNKAKINRIINAINDNYNNLNDPETLHYYLSDYIIKRYKRFDNLEVERYMTEYDYLSRETFIFNHYICNNANRRKVLENIVNTNLSEWAISSGSCAYNKKIAANRFVSIIDINNKHNLKSYDKLDEETKIIIDKISIRMMKWMNKNVSPLFGGYFI